MVDPHSVPGGPRGLSKAAPLRRGGREGAGWLSSILHHLRLGVFDPSESQRWDQSSCKPLGGSKPRKQLLHLLYLNGQRICADRRPDGTEHSSCQIKPPKPKKPIPNTPPLHRHSIGKMFPRISSRPRQTQLGGRVLGEQAIAAQSVLISRWALASLSVLSWGDERRTERG